MYTLIPTATSWAVPAGHCDTAAGAKLAIIIAPLTRARLPLVVDRCLCISTPGKTVDVVVTQRGIAVNTEGGKNVELKEKLKEAKLPVVEIADIKRMAGGDCGRTEAGTDG